MRPMARPILSWRLGPVPRAIWSASLVNAASVARSSSSRLRARSSASSGFLHTTRRSPGNLGRGDLGEVALVEQRKLEGTGIEKSADLWGSERSDPVEPGRLQFVANAGAGDHAAVTNQHNA